MSGYIIIGARPDWERLHWIFSDVGDSLSSVEFHHGKMGREEQLEERVVLDSIFPDEITSTMLPMIKTTLCASH